MSGVQALENVWLIPGDAMRVRDLSIRSRLNIGFGVCCAAILLLGILVFAGTMGIDGKATQVLKAADSAGSAQKQVQELYGGMVSINKGLRIWSVVLIALAVGFSALASILILNSIKAPIHRIAYLFTAIANGDFGVHLGGTKDEFFPSRTP